MFGMPYRGDLGLWNNQNEGASGIGARSLVIYGRVSVFAHGYSPYADTIKHLMDQSIIHWSSCEVKDYETYLM